MRKFRQHIHLDRRGTTRHLLSGLLAFGLGFFATGQRCRAEGLNLSTFPQDLLSLQDTVTIAWEENQTATFRFALIPGDGFAHNYPLTISPALASEPGLIRFIPEDHMSAGIYYCLVSDGTRSSQEFVLAISSLLHNAHHPREFQNAYIGRREVRGDAGGAFLADEKRLSPQANPFTREMSKPDADDQTAVLNAPFPAPSRNHISPASDIFVDLTGVIHDRVSTEPLPDVLVSLEDSLGHTVLDTTDSHGEYLFSARPGRHLLEFHRDGYETPAPLEITLYPCDLILWDISLNQRVALAPLSGTVTWGSEPISWARVTAKPLSGNRDYSTWTKDDGRYQFEQLPTQDSYFLEALVPGFEPLYSEPVWVTSRGDSCDFHFPRAQIFWSITEDDDLPLAGAHIHLTGAQVDISLDTDLMGTCQTPAHLPPGDYRVSITADEGHVPVAPYHLQLGRDEQRLEQVNLPIQHSPGLSERSLFLGQEAPICVEVFSPDERTQIHLYYRGPEDVDFVRVEMLPETETPSSGRSVKSDREPKLTVEQNSFSVPYWGNIPAQRQSGSLEYFIEARHRGRLYSYRSHPCKMSLAKRDVIHRAQITSLEKRHREGGPGIFTLQVFNEEGLDISNQLRDDDVVWAVLDGQGQIERSPDKPTEAVYVSQEVGPARIEATASLNGTTVSAEVQVSSQTAMLDLLEIVGPCPPEISNQSQCTFMSVALDTSGQDIPIQPGWGFQPQEAGAFTYSRDQEIVTFVPMENFIGQVRISLTDSISGQTVAYNAPEATAECDKGLAVYHLLTSETPQVVLADGAGFRLSIPDSAVIPGDTAKIFLRKPFVPDVKRYTTRHEIHGEIYDVRSSSATDFLRPVEIVLPIVPAARSLATVIGWWNPLDLEWVEIGGVVSGNEICTQVVHFSQFAVLAFSEPLAVREIQLLPNPFTPHDPYGLQLGFALSTDEARKPFVTIKVYNMAGDLIRTICENEPLPKGQYLPGESYLDSRGRDITMWDGRTATGELARNGRYLIHFRADDSSGSVEAMKTAVLIK